MRAIPNIGPLIGAYLENMHGKRAAQGPDFLSQDEQFCLTAMERMSYSENVLVVVRNVELLDDGSIRLLERMDIPEVKGSYRFLKKASFLFLEQAVNTEIGEAARTQQLRELAIWSRTIYPPDQGQFEKFLRALGLRIELDTGIFTALYNVTGGHVVLSQMLVDELNQGADANQFSDMDSFADLATRLIGIRLRSAADSKDDLTQLLALAACIGTPFNRTQLECAFVRKPRFLRILDLAKDSRYFREDVSSLSFVHEKIAEIICSIEKDKLPEYHRRIGDCLRLSRPSDYQSRLQHALLGGDVEQITQLAFAVGMQAVRKGVDQAKLLEVLQHLGPLASTLEKLRRAFILMDSGLLGNALELCGELDDAGLEIVAGEKAYVAALSYYKQRSFESYRAACRILNDWRTRDTEGELWGRLMFTLAVVEASAMPDKDDGYVTQGSTALKLSKIATSDPEIRNLLAIAHRKADVFLPLEMATDKIRSSAKHFAPQVDGMAPLDAFQYTAALTNLSANLYCRGKFDEAVEEGMRAITCCNAFHSSRRLVEFYRPMNNYLISAFRSGKMKAKAAHRHLLKTLSSLDKKNFDLVILNNNIAGLALLAGHTSQGLERLKSTYDHVKTYEFEPYYLTLVGSNLAVAQRCVGNDVGFLAILNEIDGAIDGLNDDIGRVLRIRHRAMRELTPEGPKTPTELDDFPASRVSNLQHPARHSYCRGVLLSDVQVWSES